MPKTSTSFKPGNNANPKGRPPKGYSITEWFQNMFTANPKVKEKLGQVIVQKAMRGDPTALKLVWNYMDGLPKQAIEHSGEIKMPQPIYGGKSKDKV